MYHMPLGAFLNTHSNSTHSFSGTMETHPVQTNSARNLLPHWAERNGLTLFNSLWMLQRGLNFSKHFSSKECNPCAQCAVDFTLVFPVLQTVRNLIPVQQKWVPLSLCLQRVHEILTAAGSPADQVLHFLVSQHVPGCLVTLFCWEQSSSLEHKPWLMQWTMVCSVHGCQIWVTIIYFFTPTS